MMIAPNDVWIFTADLDTRGAQLSGDLGLLSGEEKARFERFKVETPARRFVAARAFLREVLARIITTDSRSISFVYGPEGKPSLADREGLSRIEFNLSHSAEFAVLAVTRGRTVGVDVEYVRDSVEVESLAKRFFSARERESLLSLERGERQRSFFACWTRKEAYLKARGGGLTIPLDRFDVSLAPGETPCLLADRGDPDAPSSWQLHSLTLDPRAEAALAVAATTGENLSIQVNRSLRGA